MQALKWIASHPAEVGFVLFALASAIGAALPAKSPVGQFLRRFAGDLANRNLKFVPPATVQADSKETK